MILFRRLSTLLSGLKLNISILSSLESGCVITATVILPVNKAPDKRGIKDNSKIIFLISQRKHICDPSLELSNDRSQRMFY